MQSYSYILTYEWLAANNFKCGRLPVVVRFVTAAATAFAGCVLIVVNCSLFRFFFCYFAGNLV